MPRRTARSKRTPEKPLSRRWGLLGAGIALVAAIFAVFAPAMHGPFLFDDLKPIRTIADLPTTGDRIAWALDQRRPLVDLSLVLNHELASSYDERARPASTRGHHLLNILIHCLAAITLLGVVRRTLRLPRFGWPEHRATLGAFAVALLWAIHPIQTQSVAYIIQRAEAMAGLFYLLVIYCLIRAAGSERPRPWVAGAILASALGMFSKGVMISVPAAALLYDRTFLSSTFRDSLRQRWPLYAGLCATWAALALTGVLQGVLSVGGTTHHATVGFAQADLSWLDYALTQPGVILHYLWMCVWPDAVAFDYEWPVATFSGALPAIVGVGALAVAAIIGLRYRAWWGFALAWVFIVLSPTSSIVPVRDPAFAHRMYLPLAGVIALLVGFAVWLARRVPARAASPVPLRPAILGAALAAAALWLGTGAHLRSELFRSRVAIWRDTVEKRPGNVRAHIQLAARYRDIGETERALRMLDRALAIDPDRPAALFNTGVILRRMGETDRAIEHFRRAVEADPAMIPAYDNLAAMLIEEDRRDEAMRVLGAATELPRRRVYHEQHVRIRFNLGVLRLRAGDPSGALEPLQAAVRLDPTHARAHYALGVARQRLGELDEARAAYERCLEIDPSHDSARRALRSLPP